MEKKSQTNDSLMQNLPRWVFLYATASITIITSIIYSAYFLLADNDPPSLPLSYKSQPIDCGSIVSRSISYTGSKITFNVSIGNFVQYPRSAALSLMHMQARTGRVVSDYSGKNFWDATSDLHELSFSVLHPFIGNTTIDLVCSKIPLLRKNITIQEITVYPVGWSRFNPKEFTVLEAFDACWYNKSLLFSSSAPTRFEPLVFGQNMTLKINSSIIPTEALANNFKIEYTSNGRKGFHEPDAIFLNENPRYGFEKIVNILIPLQTHTYYNKANVKQTLVLTTDQIEQRPLIEAIYNGNIIDSNTNQCYGNVIVLPSTHSPRYLVNQSIYINNSLYPGYEHMEYVTRIKREIYNTIRDKIATKKQRKQTIAVDSASRGLISPLKKLYPHAEINIIDDAADIFITANLVSKSSILVGSNIMLLAYSIFLQEGATIVEVLPEGQECIRACMRWSHCTGAKYVPLGREPTKKHCTSKTFEDYFMAIPNFTYPALTIDQIKKVFDPLML